MWPLKIDMTKDECRGALRHLELEAYSSVISTFRAQGSLDTFKHNVLDQLRKVFNISEDRHKAEVRRVANSEKLTTISELLTGKANDLEWIREGHRNYPLIARAPPYSALHILAEHASKASLAENSSLPEPCDTRRTQTLDHEIPGKQIITDDPTLPPPSPSVFGINRKELKKTYEMSTMQQNLRKKHYSMLKPPPPPNLKIQHLYQTLNTKRPRKSLTKKSSKIKKLSPSSSRAQQMHSPADQKQFDNAELHKHLTSKLMPPPMSPMKSPTSQYQPILPATSKQRGNIQTIEPQTHYLPNNPSRLKSELLAGMTSPNKKRVKNITNIQPKNHFQQQKFANGAGARPMDHIPDPQIIFNTSSSSPSSSVNKVENEVHIEHHNQHDLDTQASPLQLLSTAASCTPKLKVNSATVNQQQSQQQQYQAIKTNVSNRAIKIIPANSKPVVIKSTEIVSKSTQQLQTTNPQQQQQSKIKIQKFQLMMNRSQDGIHMTSQPSNLSPTATIVSSKPGQLVLSGKAITSSYQVGKSPYAINAIVTTPKTTTLTATKVEDNQNDANVVTTNSNSNFPKVIIKSSPATTTAIPSQGKQIKLKLGTNIVNTKILTAPLTSFKIQRNVNTKGFTVLNPSHIVQIQQQQQSLSSTQIAITPTTTTNIITPTITTTTESTKVDWEQELDDVNRVKGGKSQSNGSDGPIAKKIKLDEMTMDENPKEENVIVETTVDDIIEEDVTQSTNQIVAFDETPEVPSTNDDSQQNEIVSEFVYFKDDSEALAKGNEKEVDVLVEEVKINGDSNISTELNGEIDVDKPQNGAEAYENLVKSLTDDLMKEIGEETIGEENFGLIEGNMIDQFSNFTSQSGLF